MFTNLEWFNYKAPKFDDEVEHRINSMLNEIEEIVNECNDTVSEMSQAHEVAMEELEDEMYDVRDEVDVASKLCRKLIDLINDSATNDALYAAAALEIKKSRFR